MQNDLSGAKVKRLHSCILMVGLDAEYGRVFELLLKTSNRIE